MWPRRWNAPTVLHNGLSKCMVASTATALAIGGSSPPQGTGPFPTSTYSLIQNGWPFLMRCLQAGPIITKPAQHRSSTSCPYSNPPEHQSNTSRGAYDNPRHLLYRSPPSRGPAAPDRPASLQGLPKPRLGNHEALHPGALRRHV